MSLMPTVAIVGRPNVGKSSLLNALTGKRVSIAHDMPGVTRDRISMPLAIPLSDAQDAESRYVELVDTGGYGFIDPDNLTEHIKHQIELAMARANLVVFVVDASVGLTAGDEEIASLLRRLNQKVLLVANKADSSKADVILGDFARLGLGTPVGVSATNDRNLDDLLAALRDHLDLTNAPADVPEPEMLVAIVGKRNAGKSTLVNAIARLFEGDPERVIVSEVPGTTRDSVDVTFQKDNKTLTVIDTAGVRKKRHMVTNDVEFYSFHRAQRSVRRADVVLLLIDATIPVSEPDQKLAQYIAEQYKPVILVINKWDLAREEIKKRRSDGDRVTDTTLMEEYRAYLDQELRFLDYAPIAFVTAKEGKNVPAVVDLARHLFKQATTRVTTGQLNRAMETVLEERSLSAPGGRRIKVYYATQIEVAPPTIVLFVNRPEDVEEGYLRFVRNRFRELLPYGEVPIKLFVRGRAGRTQDQDPAAKPTRPGHRKPNEPTARKRPAAKRAVGGRRTGGKSSARRKQR